MNKLFLGLFLVINIYGYDVKNLKNEFYKNVVLKNIYNEYNTTMEKLEAIKYYKKISKFTQYEKYSMKDKILKIIRDKNIINDEYFSIVNLEKQLYTILLYINDEEKVYIIGSSLITSGNIELEKKLKNGEDHFFDTPVGLYNVKKAWRSDGKFKAKRPTVQAYGSKGRFIYYFGKEQAKRYHIFDKKGQKYINEKDYKIIYDTLNFAIHSYNSQDKRGYKNSHGCVRLSDELNIYLEKNLVLHKNFFKDNKWHLKYSYKPENLDINATKGSYVLIINSL